MPQTCLQPTNTDSLDSITKELKSRSKRVAIEYAQLSTLPLLSKEQADRMSQILKSAQSDSLLNFWITEVDHVLEHKLE